MADTLFENMTPVLPVRDLERSIEFFQRTLGLELQWKAPTVCSVGQGSCSIMLRQTDDGSKATVWIGCDASLFPRLLEAGVTILQPPTQQPWAYEMKFADPDGNTLWLGSEPATG
ncbi:MAG TPA: VOC family protein [Polyangiaceae bacterium]|nr:VOC family protein [Polyangiaceae bacterium]